VELARVDASIVGLGLSATEAFLLRALRTSGAGDVVRCAKNGCNGVVTPVLPDFFNFVPGDFDVDDRSAAWIAIAFGDRRPFTCVLADCQGSLQLLPGARSSAVRLASAAIAWIEGDAGAQGTLVTCDPAAPDAGTRALAPAAPGRLARSSDGALLAWIDGERAIRACRRAQCSPLDLGTADGPVDAVAVTDGAVYVAAATLTARALDAPSAVVTLARERIAVLTADARGAFFVAASAPRAIVHCPREGCASPTGVAALPDDVRFLGVDDGFVYAATKDTLWKHARP
jgi:hypothetical protein